MGVAACHVVSEQVEVGVLEVRDCADLKLQLPVKWLIPHQGFSGELPSPRRALSQQTFSTPSPAGRGRALCLSLLPST